MIGWLRYRFILFSAPNVLHTHLSQERNVLQVGMSAQLCSYHFLRQNEDMFKNNTKLFDVQKTIMVVGSSWKSFVHHS